MLLRVKNTGYYLIYISTQKFNKDISSIASPYKRPDPKDNMILLKVQTFI